MATKPASTMFYDAVKTWFNVSKFMLIGNQIVMFFFNLIAPRWAAEFANDREIFSEEITEMYAKRAVKWPFLWAKWWMEEGSLKNVSIERQIEYFFKANSSKKTLKRMSEEALEKLFFDYGEENYPQSEYFTPINNSVFSGISIKDILFRLIRPTDKIFDELVKNEDTDILKMIISRGALTENQLERLVNQVIAGKNVFIDVLADYAGRYGLKKELSQNIPETEETKAIFEAKRAWNQCNSVRTYAGLENDMVWAEWKKFCKETEISPKAQLEMTKDQYLIFNEAGRSLAEEVIIEILKSGRKDMIAAVLSREDLSPKAESLAKELCLKK